MPSTQIGDVDKCNAVSMPLTKQDLPILRHSGVLVRLESQDGTVEWIKLEFGIEGLNFVASAVMPPVSNSYLTEPCDLHAVSPDVLANCLSQSKTRTYNAAR